jgi:DNA-binding winged helix-turn-helix (wHTH) protein
MAISAGHSSLLVKSDGLLERIEQLRLLGLLRLPGGLRQDLVSLADSARGDAEERVPVTVASAHGYVFDLQAALMNPRRSSARRGRGGEAARTGLDLRPRLLELPARDQEESEVAWAEAVRLTVQRAHDRSSLLAAQAAATERLARAEGARLRPLRTAQAEAARANLEQLRDEATRLVGSAPEPRPLPVLPGGRLRRGDLLIDPARGHVRRRGEHVEMTATEGHLLAALASNPSRVMSREALVHMVHGDDPRVDLESRALEVHLVHVRRKLGDSAEIETVPRLGYRWVAREVTARLTTGAPAPERHRASRRQSVTRTVEYDYTQQSRRDLELGRGR